MTEPLEQPPFDRSSFAQACDYCGAAFEVFIARLAGSDIDEDYHCPECEKRFRVSAALEPLVRLRSRRTDGKSDRYQETMF